MARIWSRVPEPAEPGLGIETPALPGGVGADRGRCAPSSVAAGPVSSGFAGVRPGGYSALLQPSCPRRRRGAAQGDSVLSRLAVLALRDRGGDCVKELIAVPESLSGDLFR